MTCDQFFLLFLIVLVAVGHSTGSKISEEDDGSDLLLHASNDMLLPSHHVLRPQAFLTANTAEFDDDIRIWKRQLKDFKASIPDYPRNKFSGKGIVTTSGRRSYFTAAFVTISSIRLKVKSGLPIEVFYGGEKELPAVAVEYMEKSFENVRFIDLTSIPEAQGLDIYGYQMKAFAIYFSSFKEVLWLDSDNIPLVSPDNIFDSNLYQEHGAVFWPG